MSWNAKQYDDFYSKIVVSILNTQFSNTDSDHGPFKKVYLTRTSAFSLAEKSNAAKPLLWMNSIYFRSIQIPNNDSLHFFYSSFYRFVIYALFNHRMSTYHGMRKFLFWNIGRYFKGNNSRTWQHWIKPDHVPIIKLHLTRTSGPSLPECDAARP